MTSEEDQREQVIRGFQRLRLKGKEVVEHGSAMARAGQEAVDLAEATIPLMHYPLPRDFLTSAGDYVNRQVAAQDAFLSGTQVYTASITASSSGTAFTLSQQFDSKGFLDRLPPQDRGSAADMVKRLDAVVERVADKERALALMRDFGLDEASPGTLSPVAMLETAHEAFELPVGADDQAITSHVPARGALEATIARLIKHRPAQEPASGNRTKVVSICTQLGRPGMSQERIDDLADRYHYLYDELSGSKSKLRGREAARVLLNRATLYIVELLGALDPHRLR